MSHPAKDDRTRRLVLVVVVLTCFLGAAPAPRADPRLLLAIRAPWCLPARPAGNAAGYLLIDNRSEVPDRLSEITSPLAQHVSIHESRVDGGLATMKTLGEVAIPARTIVRFAPGGLHLMLESLRRPLNVGEKVPVTLSFKVAGQVRTSLVVVLRPPNSAMSSMRM